MALTQGDVPLKTSGGDYSTWQGFLVDLANLTGDITLTVDASQFTETAYSVPTENLGGHTITVTAATFPTTTDGTTGPRIVSNTGCNYPLDNQMEGPGAWVIEGICFITGTKSPSYVIISQSVSTAFTFTFRRCIIKGGVIGFYGYDSTVIHRIYNNFIYDCSAEGLKDINGNNSDSVSNNTVIGCGEGIDAAGDSRGQFENNICYGNTTDFTNIGSATGNNNTSYDDTCADANWDTGANNRESKTADPFTASGDDDFTLAASSDPIGNGKDLSGDFTDDFFGDTRSTWDIGADYYASAAPPTSAAVAAFMSLNTKFW